MDAIEIDLGELTLQTRSIQSQPPPASGGAQQTLLVEAVDLCFSGVGCTVVQAGKRGGNVLQNAESGWRLGWRRPLQLELRGDQPMVSAPPPTIWRSGSPLHPWLTGHPAPHSAPPASNHPLSPQASVLPPCHHFLCSRCCSL